MINMNELSFIENITADEIEIIRELFNNKELLLEERERKLLVTFWDKWWMNYDSSENNNEA